MKNTHDAPSALPGDRNHHRLSGLAKDLPSQTPGRYSSQTLQAQPSGSVGHDTSRRYILAQGARLTAMGSLGALFSALGVATPALGQGRGQGWAAHLRQRHQGGYGIVKHLAGFASADGGRLAVGMRVESGQEVSVAPKGLLILSLMDNTIMRINANTRVILEISRRRTGLFRLLVGSLLTVMPIGNRYLAQLPTTVIGIKGTVFFQQIYHPGERFALDAFDNRVQLPEGITEYFCLCNGEADYMTPQSTSLYFSDNSQYHNSYYIDPTAENPMVEAPQLNHTDEEILDLIERQEGEKHDAAFLDDYIGGND